jgi:hypothetical protein
MSHLNPPPLATQAEGAKEVLRVWVAQGDRQEVALLPVWDDPGAWGLLLVDIAQHAANAYEAAGHNRAIALTRIKQLFDAEWNAPTDVPQELVD